MKLIVYRQCRADSGETLKEGQYDYRLIQRLDVNSPGGMAEPVYVALLPDPPFEVDVTSLVKSGQVQPN